MSVFDFLWRLHSECCHFQTREGSRVGPLTSKSEMRRWFERKSVIVNGLPANAADPVPSEWVSLVLFPRNPVTLL